MENGTKFKEFKMRYLPLVQGLLIGLLPNGHTRRGQPSSCTRDKRKEDTSEHLLLDAASSKQKVGEGNKADLKVRSSVVVSSSSSTADSGRRKWLVSEGGDSSKSGEAIYVDCSGMCSHEYTAVQGNVETRFIGEQDLLGSRIEVPPVELASDQISTPKVSNNGLDQTSNLEVLNGGSDQAVILFNGLFKPSCWIWKILALPKLWMFRVYWAHRLMHLTKRTYRISR
ncbi:hypothetical protein V6N11_068550 [Hibiscus sabdariffa]|uniref:Uncharacterized protein n=1 Tax=Hibiscus sabdariffa TaxID=183260 RepID=A0ABR2PA17_9ROSI